MQICSASFEWCTDVAVRASARGFGTAVAAAAAVVVVEASCAAEDVVGVVDGAGYVAEGGACPWGRRDSASYSRRSFQVYLGSYVMTTVNVQSYFLNCLVDCQSSVVAWK